LKNKDIRDYLNDIIGAAVKIQEFTQGITSYNEFIRNDMLLSAVIRKFEIIGEAIKKVPIDIREKYNNISWKNIAGARDRLIHGYDDIDYEILWDTVINDIPRLKSDIEKIIKEL
jgi:uncharacterized protein with HEPN domain